MKLEIILLIVISIGFGISLVYFIGYNKISIIKAKMDAANDIISKALKDKKDIMNEIYDKYKEKQELDQKLADLKDKEAELRVDVDKLQDPDYIARYAREKYLYSKDGEFIIKIPEE